MANPIKLTPEQLAAFVPDQGAAAGPAPVKLTPEQLAAFVPEAAPAAAAPPPDRVAPYGLSGMITGQQQPEEPDVGTLEAIGRSASNAMYFGFGPAISAGMDYATQAAKRIATGEEPKYTFDQLRAIHAARLDAGRAQHPIATTVADVGGSIPATVLTPELAALKGAAPVVRGAVQAGTQAGITGAGEAISHGKSAPEVAREAATAAVVGSAVGGALEHVTSAFVRDAPKNAKNWVLKEIIGEEGKGGSTPTTRKALVQQKEAVLDVVDKDAELAAKLAKAEHGKPEDIAAAAEHVAKRQSEVYAPRRSLYEQADKLAGEVKVKGVVDKVEGRIEQLAKTVGTKSERNALRAVADDIKATLGGGEKMLLDPKAEIQPGFPASRMVDLLKKNLEKATTAEAKAGIQADLDKVLADHSRRVDFDENAVAKSIDLRDGVSRLQEDVRNAMGALNEKASYKKAREVLAPVYDALDEHLEKVAAKDPKLVEQIREMNRTGSALERIEEVLKERSSRAEQKEVVSSVVKAARGAHAATPLGAVMAASTGHYKTAAALAAAAAAPIAKRNADRAMAALIKRASAGPLTRAEADAAVKAGVAPAIVDKLLRFGARGAVGAVEKVIPRVAGRQVGARAAGFVSDFLDAQGGE